MLQAPNYFVEGLRPFLPAVYYDFLTEEDRRLFLLERYTFMRERNEDNKIQVINPPIEQYWLINSTIVEIASRDSAFLVETLLDYLAHCEYRIGVLIHPVLYTKRDANGILEDLTIHVQDGYKAESYIYLQIGRLSNKDAQLLESNLRKNYAQLSLISSDFESMREKLDTQLQSRKADQTWFRENLVLLGYADSDIRHGLLRDPDVSVDLEELYRARPFSDTSLRSRSNPRRKVMCFRFEDRGRTGVFVGHFAHRAHSQNLLEIPPLSGLLTALYERYMAGESSFMRKRIARLLREIPVGLLFSRSADFFYELSRFAFANNFAEESESILLRDSDNEMLWLLATVPRRDSAEVPGEEFQSLLRQENWESPYQIRFPLERNELLLYAIQVGAQADRAFELLEERRAAILETWSARLRRLIANRFSGEEQIHYKRNLYFSGMSENFTLGMSPEESLVDLELLESMLDTGAHDTVRVRYYRRHLSEQDCIKIYSTRLWLVSDLVPVLTNFGFVIEEENTAFFERGLERAHVHAFFVPGRPEEKPEKRRIADCLELVLNGASDSSPLDALSLLSRLTPDELILAKALNAYYWQTEKSLPYLGLYQFCLQYPAWIRALIDLFHARLSPSPSIQEKEAMEALTGFFTSLRSAMDEQVGTHFQQIVLAIVRTNFYQKNPELSFKIKSSLIDRMPEPVPYFEIFVFSNYLEGIHLRGGKVARGGLRWSDRQDYRTEVLALMKAQMVKNTVIVPEGSKGGFLLKKPPADPAAFREAGVQAYKRYIHALLGLTDSYRAGTVVRPAGIVCLDDADPYLVVAADKGTATFSDIANGIAHERGFWLDDAFASGGQNGYDHKKQGITARGAWESVKSHFAELGVDPEKDKITVAGIGDMSGDVFGNGLLLSDSVQLLFAFNHRFIFLDPDPDPESSYRERKRLFESVLNWDAYDTNLFSPGGGVHPRDSRSIELSQAVRKRLGTDAAHLSGEELIKAILQSPVDLLWNGGVGTYIKSSRETHFQANDATNDRVRIDANELRCRVLAEGGNLGLTQAARLEAADQGVRLNTDAIDNSAGVDMSDHEVNLKILLTSLEEEGLLDRPARDRLIRELDPAMVGLVLEHNRSNNLALSLEVMRVSNQFHAYREWIKVLSKLGVLNREADAVPFESDLDRIEKTQKKLARPLLAALMGFTKLHLSRQLLAATEELNFPELLSGYFPTVLQERYPGAIEKHPLAREIVVTEVINRVINSLGITIFQRLQQTTGGDYVTIARVCMKLLSKIPATSFLPGERAIEARYRYEEFIYYSALKILSWQGYGELLLLPDAELEDLLKQAAAVPEQMPLQLETLLDFRMLGQGGDRDLFLSQAEEFSLGSLRQFIRTRALQNTWEQGFARRLEKELLVLLITLSQLSPDLRQPGRAILGEISLLQNTGSLTLPAMLEIVLRSQQVAA
ncbi:MAG: NAD-glutamate dehydrogenase [Spirochaetales bacterium]|nr:NAD-glutamate dehydrogenase [Spirochaetales bacterium]